MTRTEIIAQAIFRENAATNEGAETNTKLFWHLLGPDEVDDMLALAKIVEVVVERFNMVEYNDLKETCAGAMVEGYTGGLPWDTAPDYVRKHWLNLADVAIKAYREAFFEPTEERILLHYKVEE